MQHAVYIHFDCTMAGATAICARCNLVQGAKYGARANETAASFLNTCQTAEQVCKGALTGQ